MLKIDMIYNMDCLDGMKQIPNDIIDLVVTSPPYYNAKKYIQYNSVADYMTKMQVIFSEIERILKLSRICAINISPVLVGRSKRSEQSHRIPLPFYFVPMMEKIGFEFLEDIIWKKPDGAVVNRNGGFYVHRKPITYKPNIVTEYILIFKKKADFLIDKILRNDSIVHGNYERTNVWEIQPETKSYHPASYPEKLAENIIRYYSYEGEIVYDPFIGGGTTAVVCKQLNRRFIGFEIDKKYYDIAKARINAMVTLHKWI